MLTPVKREDFKENFSAGAHKGNVQPQEYFAPVIQQIKKLAVGNYFWFIADAVNGRSIYLGGMIEKIVAIPENEFLQHPPDLLFRRGHPEDMARMFAFTNHWISFFMGLSAERRQHVRPTMYIRMLNPEEEYKWVMVQYVDQILNDAGLIIYGLTLVTDISHIKNDGVAMMSILDTYDDSCQLFFCSDGVALPDTDKVLPKISQREIEVLRYLAVGYSSKQIASELKIAVKTIDNHRQNLLRKTNTKSSGELVAFGINMGYI